MEEILKVTKERVLAAAKECPTADQTLRKLFPEAFLNEWRDVTAGCVLRIGPLTHSLTIYHPGTERYLYRLIGDSPVLEKEPNLEFETQIKSGRIWIKKS